MTCTILVSGNNAISNTTAVRWRKSHEGVPFNIVHFKHYSYLNKLVTRWQKENMSTLQKIPTHVLLVLPLSGYFVVIWLSLSGIYMHKSHQVTNSHMLYDHFCMASIIFFWRKFWMKQEVARHGKWEKLMQCSIFCTQAWNFPCSFILS